MAWGLIAAVVVAAVLGYRVFQASAATTTLYPSGANARSSANWTFVGAAATALDTNDTDTSYATVAAGNRNLYMDIDDPVVSSGTINSVTVYVLARNTTGNEQVTLGLSDGTTDLLDTVNDQPGATYTQYSYSSTTRPAGGAWTWSDITNLQGIARSRSNGSWGGEMRLTQMWVVVDYTAGTLTVSQGAGSGRPTTKIYASQGSAKAVDELNFVATTGPMTVTGVTVRGLDTLGTLQTDVTGVALFVDNGDGSYGAGDTQLGTTQTFSGNASGSTATFSGLSQAVAVGTPVNVWVVYTIGASAAQNRVVGSQLVDGDVTASGGTVTFSASPITSANTGQTIQVDATAPSANTSDPLDNAVLTGSSKTISGTASDGSGSGVASVQVRIARSDGQYWTGSGWSGTEAWNPATGTTSWTYAWSLDAGQNNGPYTYTVTARATDGAGLVGTDPTPATGVKVDNVVPAILSASALDSTHVDVVFSESLQSGSISASDFTIAGLTVSGATLQGDNITVRLTTSAQTSSQAYTVQCPAGNVLDLAGNGNSSASAGFTGFVSATLTVAQAGDAGRPSAKIYRGQGANQVVDELALTAGGGAVTLTGITVRGLDTVAALQADVTGVRLYRDNGVTVGQWDGSDSQIGGSTQTFSGNASGSTATFSGLSLSIPNGATEKVWIVYTIGASAIDGHIVGSQVNDGDVTATGGTVNTFANVVSANTGQTIQVDAAAPNANTSDPADNAVLTSTTKTISGTASDGSGSGAASTGAA